MDADLQRAFEPRDAHRFAGFRMVTRFSLAFAIFGLVIIVVHGGFQSDTTAPLLWAFACSAAGFVVGFVFGIPRVVQSPPPSPPGGAVPPGEAERRAYRHQVNSNLSEISDWLTKIIVGLSLIHIRSIPPALDHAALTLAHSLTSSTVGEPAAKSFAYAVIVCYSATGFLYGYLTTRLFLASIMSDADRDAIGEQIGRVVAQSSAHAMATDPNSAREVPSPIMREAAEQVENLAALGETEVVQRQLLQLAEEYERTRARMLPGDNRTQRMEVIVTKMRTLALAGYALLPEFSRSTAPGRRLAAVVMLQMKPDPGYLSWLADRLKIEVAFVGYQSAVALLTAARTLGAEHTQAIREAIRTAKQSFAEKDRGTDRYQKLEEAERELARDSPDPGGQAAGPPIRLEAVAGTASIILTWGALPGVLSYNVYRAETGQPRTLLRSDIGGTTFTDTAVVAGTTYSYHVSAKLPAGESGPSNDVSVTAT